MAVTSPPSTVSGSTRFACNRYQRAMSRKVKFSNNWRKAKAKVQKIHSRIGNVRRDFLHKATTTDQPIKSP